MLGCRVSRLGRPGDVVELVQYSEPRAAAGEVVVEIEAAPIHATDLLAARGLYPWSPKPPYIPGLEGCGYVRELGAGVDADVLGRRVLLPLRAGSWRERIAVPAQKLAEIPASLTVDVAARLSVDALSAWAMLERHVGDAHEGAIVVAPGQGGVGRAIVTLAGRRALPVVALVRHRRMARELEAVGAHVVVDDGEHLVETLTKACAPLGGASVAFDGLAGAVSGRLASALRPGGALVIYGGVSRTSPTLPLSALLFEGKRVQGFWLRDWMERDGRELVSRAIRELVADPPPFATAASFPLRWVHEALAATSSARDGARILLRPDVGGV
jgi:NADPH:quinone reductase-like Zn-dependent oxidoreductase